MARLSFDEWKKRKEGGPEAGVPSQAMDTPSETVPKKRPRMTFSEWKAQKQDTPQVSQETTKEVATAETPQAPQQEPLKGSQGQDVRRFYSDPTSRAGSLMAGLPQEITEGADVTTQEEVVPFVKEEGLPIAGGIAATAALPASLSVGLAGWAATAAASGAGSTAGEFIEQSLKKFGLLDAPADQPTPKTWGDVAKASIGQGSEDAAITAGTDALLRLTPKAIRGVFTVGSHLRDNNKFMMKVLKEKEGPIMASDVSEGLIINYTNSAVTNSFAKVGRQQKEIVKEQARVLGEAAQEPLTDLIKKSGLSLTEQYEEVALRVLPDEVAASHLTTVLKDGERAAKDVAGSLYDALDEVAKSGPTKTVSHTEMRPTGVLDREGNMIEMPTTVTKEMAEHTVDVKGARSVMENEIDELAKDLTSEAAADYTQYAKSQLRLFAFNDEISVGGAFNHIKQMSKDARALARSSDEGAATKRMWLLKSMDELMGAMDSTAQRMADMGIQINGKDAMTVKREADSLWKEASETFGNRYVTDIVNKAGEVEGHAAALAGSMMQNKQSADAIMNAIELSERSAEKTARYGLSENISKTRAAVSAKVYENMLARVLVKNEPESAVRLLNTPDSRKALRALMGEETLGLLDTSVRALAESMNHGMNVGAFTQFARESAALSTPPLAPEQMSRAIATFSFPRVLAKGLRSEKVVKKLQGLGAESDFNKRNLILGEIITETMPLMWTDYENLSEEELQKLEYQNRLSQL